MNWLFKKSRFYKWSELKWKIKDKIQKGQRTHIPEVLKLEIISHVGKTPLTSSVWIYFHASLRRACIFIPTESQALDDGVLREVYHHLSLCLHHSLLQSAQQSFWGPGCWVPDADSSSSFHHQLHHVRDAMVRDRDLSVDGQGEPESVWGPQPIKLREFISCGWSENQRVACLLFFSLSLLPSLPSSPSLIP